MATTCYLWLIGSPVPSDWLHAHTNNSTHPTARKPIDWRIRCYGPEGQPQVKTGHYKLHSNRIHKHTHNHHPNGLKHIHSYRENYQTLVCHSLLVPEDEPHYLNDLRTSSCSIGWCGVRRTVLASSGRSKLLARISSLAEIFTSHTGRPAQSRWPMERPRGMSLRLSRPILDHCGTLHTDIRCCSTWWEW